MAGENDLQLRRINITGNDLEIGRSFDGDRTLVISATTGGATAAIRLGHRFLVAISATTAGATAQVRADYDPNLLSAIHTITETRWQEAEPARPGVADHFQPAQLAHGEGLTRWQEAEALPGGNITVWQDADRLDSSGFNSWNEGALATGYAITRWQQATFAATAGHDRWQEGRQESTSVVSVFQVSLPRPTLDPKIIWGDGITLTLLHQDRFTDGLLLIRELVEVWQEGGLLHNAPRYGPAIQPRTYVWDGVLDLVCHREPSTLVRLNIGAPPCPGIGQRRIYDRRTYLVLNSASLTLLSDGTELPCTSMTIKTDANSWCWGLSASLTGSAAWALVQPTPAGYPVEVRATINDWTWDFVLDYPGLSRKFNNSNLTVEGRSRSAWLDEPWTPRTTGRQPFPRTAQQLAEEALENTGWTLDWRINDWLVPGGRFEWDNSLIGRINRLVKPVEGCVYTDPHEQVITVYPRYEDPSWLWDGLTPDLELPEGVLMDLSRKPNLTPAYNGVYVSGTDYGVLAFVRIAGTDGMKQPGQPIVEALCCDEDGVAARMRGLAFLSANGGSGFTLTGRTVLGRYLYTSQNNPPLIVPGDSVRIGGSISKTMLARGVSINASRSGGWTGVLTVTQTVELEGWDVEP